MKTRMGISRCCCGGGGGATPCSVCSSGTTPAQLQVVLSGMQSNPGYTFSAACAFCASLDGTYVLNQVTACSWEKNLPSVICEAGQINASLVLFGGNPRLSISLQFTNFGSTFNVIWQEDFTSPFDCSSLSSTPVNDSITVQRDAFSNHRIQCIPNDVSSSSTTCLVTAL